MDHETAGKIKKGDIGEIILDAFDGQKLQGKVVEIRDSRENKGKEKELILEVHFDFLEQGQQGDVKFEKRSQPYDFLVSNAAVGRDNKGFFVYIPEEKKSYLGNELVARMVRVTIGESDNEKTAIVQGLRGEDKVIKASDKPLSDGSRMIWSD